MGKRFLSLLLSVLLTLVLTACSEKAGEPVDETSQAVTEDSSEGQNDPASTLTVRFGHGGDSFDLYLEDNDTAAAIARHVGTADWNLPIYHYDDYEGWEVFQYYDMDALLRRQAGPPSQRPRRLHHHQRTDHDELPPAGPY